MSEHNGTDTWQTFECLQCDLPIELWPGVSHEPFCSKACEDTKACILCGRDWPTLFAFSYGSYCCHDCAWDVVSMSDICASFKSQKKQIQDAILAMLKW